MVGTIILTAIASSGLFTFLQFLITRSDSKKKDETRSTIKKLERDGIRTQMLVLMNHYPADTKEIMKLAEYYFSVLNGDWYMTSIFNKWLTENKIGKPEWFNSIE